MQHLNQQHLVTRMQRGFTAEKREICGGSRYIVAHNAPTRVEKAPRAGRALLTVQILAADLEDEASRPQAVGARSAVGSWPRFLWWERDTGFKGRAKLPLAARVRGDSGPIDGAVGSCCKPNTDSNGSARRGPEHIGGGLVPTGSNDYTGAWDRKMAEPRRRHKAQRAMAESVTAVLASPRSHRVWRRETAPVVF